MASKGLASTPATPAEAAGSSSPIHVRIPSAIQLGGQCIVGSESRASVMLENTDAHNSLAVLGIETSCGCVLASIDRKLIPPRSEAIVDVTLTFGPFDRANTVFVQVRTDRGLVKTTIHAVARPPFDGWPEHAVAYGPPGRRVVHIDDAYVGLIQSARVFAKDRGGGFALNVSGQEMALPDTVDDCSELELVAVLGDGSGTVWTGPIVYAFK
ncbi:MAG: hypothetical protein AB7Q91_09625 [Phycisphaerales bacterium]